MSSAELWAASGAMHLSGLPGGPPMLAPGTPALAAQEWVANLAALAGNAGFPVPALDGPALFAERAALSGLSRNAPWNLSETCRAVRCADGWVAVNLARSDDHALLPALLCADGPGGPWELLERELPRRAGAEWVDRAELLGLPLAAVGGPVASPAVTQTRPGPARTHRPRVLDLSTLWAGPLAGSLLGLCGAEVVRVESVQRPDGSRLGVPGFDDLLHGGQESVTFDLHRPARLHELIASADIVISSARKRALDALGIDPPGVWAAVTGYGLASSRVGFGDDCAMAGGLVRWVDGVPVPVGDAIADPLTGMWAAAEALRCHLAGGSWLIDAPLAGVAASVAGPVPDGDVHRHGNAWCVETSAGHTAVALPRARRRT